MLVYTHQLYLIIPAGDWFHTFILSKETLLS